MKLKVKYIGKLLFKVSIVLKLQHHREIHTSCFVRPVAAVRHSVAARRRRQAAPAVGARESVRVTRDQVTVLLVRVVAAVVVSVAAPSARDAAIQLARAMHLVIGALT